MVLLSLWLTCLYWIILVDGKSEGQGKGSLKRPVFPTPTNILMILADDLGYGDTSVFPFVGTGIQTPNLEKMASRGVVLTNFHSAAATCTPTRASILTGLYPWRLGAKSVYEYSQKGHSNRDDWLVQVPNAPMVFAENNYSTFHSGKWHLGGMRNDDLAMRLQPDKGTEVPGGRRCPHPGPIQQGFHSYVSVLDGPGSPRQNELQVHSSLYSKGCNFLLEDDQTLSTAKYNISGWLSYCEAKHAMRAIERSVAENKPFYIHLWFHAPHGPWQVIPGYDDLYRKKQKRRNIIDPKLECGHLPDFEKFSCFVNVNKRQQLMQSMTKQRWLEYRSMVSDMDAQIGMILDHLDQLGISQNTLAFFTSDNGPEDGSGTSGSFRGNKRHLYEGGIRVPAIAQWIDTIPAGNVVPSMTISADLFPTFLDAANIKMPSHVHIDGLSFLPELLSVSKTSKSATKSQDKQIVAAAATGNGDKIRGHQHIHRKQMLMERMYLWINDYEGPRRTAAMLYEYKVLLDEDELPFEMFDLRFDPTESRNLLGKYSKPYWRNFVTLMNNGSVSNSAKTAGKDVPKLYGHTAHLTRNAIMKDRRNATVHSIIVERIFRTILSFAIHGDEGYRKYLEQHPGHRYDPSPLSDTIPMVFGVGMTTQKAKDIEAQLVTQGSCGTTPCSCDQKIASEVKPLPFPALVIKMAGDVISTNVVDIPGQETWWNPIIPQPFLNGSRILELV